MYHDPNQHKMSPYEKAPTTASTFKSIGHSLTAILSSTSTTVQQSQTEHTMLKCRYKTNRCDNPRTLKPNGTPHSLCSYHRMKQNQAQAKSDRKRRVSITKRRRERRFRLKQQEENTASRSNLASYTGLESPSICERREP